MKNLGIFPLRKSGFAWLGILVLGALGFVLGALSFLGDPAAFLARTGFGAGSATLAQAPRPLSANDVSILFPLPRNTDDLANLIGLADLNGPTGRLWSEADFTRFIGIAESPAGQVAGISNRIELPPEVKQIDAWFIAGIRIDPGAPGLSQSIIDQFGRSPQIRFVAQPVTSQPGGGVKVHDIAAHLIFSFSLPSNVALPDPAAAPECFPRPKPDLNAFQAVVNDAVALRDRLAAGEFGGARIDTAGPLNVHPGLTGASAKPFRDALSRDMLQKHLVSQRLRAMAIMALDTPEPWIFVAMQKIDTPSGPTVVPVPSPMLDGQQIAQALNFRGGDRVVPAPATNNQNPITCRHAAIPPRPPLAPLPVAGRKGVATAELFQVPPPTPARAQEIIDIIADPIKSHFFNTDCVSCHTDTRRAMELLQANTVPGVATQTLPQGRWNVRNFGWFPGAPTATVTRRTATETAEVVKFINAELLAR